MLNQESPTVALEGSYRDVLCDAGGRVTWDGGWRKNLIVQGCRQLLAQMMCGQGVTAVGIQGLQVGAGSAAWDSGLPPPPTPSDTQLIDPNPFTVIASSLVFSYLDPLTGVVSLAPTNRLQIVATLGPNEPSWPDANHTTSTLREFGLVGKVGTGASAETVLINEVRHVAIPKDAVSTLVRTIQLVF
jgi:hypothetical protein